METNLAIICSKASFIHTAAGKAKIQCPSQSCLFVRVRVNQSHVVFSCGLRMQTGGTQERVYIIFIVYTVHSPSALP